MLVAFKSQVDTPMARDEARHIRVIVQIRKSTVKECLATLRQESVNAANLIHTRMARSLIMVSEV